MKRNGLEALNFQHKLNYNRSVNFEYTTETIMFLYTMLAPLRFVYQNLFFLFIYKENNKWN